jgi:hypothetical protein
VTQNDTHYFDSLIDGAPGIYHNDARCVYYVSGNQIESQIFILIESFSLEKDYDYLSIGDGHDPLKRGSLLVRLTGQVILRSLMSSGPKMWIKFITDSSTNDGGFKLKMMEAGEDSKFRTLFILKVIRINILKLLSDLMTFLLSNDFALSSSISSL